MTMRATEGEREAARRDLQRRKDERGAMSEQKEAQFEEMATICPTCGHKARVVGGEDTLHYEPVEPKVLAEGDLLLPDLDDFIAGAPLKFYPLHSMAWNIRTGVAVIEREEP